MRLIAAGVSALALIGGPAMACTPAAGDQADSRAQDLRAVTSVYEARIENVVLHDQYGDSLDFTIRPTAPIWGPMAAEPLRLSFEAGACSNWFFLMEDDSPPRDGLKVIVLANPDGLADHHWLYILRADAPYIDGFMSDWRAARAGQPRPRHQ